MSINTQTPQFTTVRVRPDSVKKLKEGEDLFRKKRGVKPDHSEAMSMAVEAWIRELKAA